MPHKIHEGRPPLSPLKRWLFRAPTYLYGVGLGFLMGGRFMLLEHQGRNSGLDRRSVIEVVKHDPATGRYYACSGFGEHADWYQNLVQTPRGHITVGRRRMAVWARVLPADEAGELMLDYARRYPRTAVALVRSCGYVVDGSEQDWRALGASEMRFLEFALEGSECPKKPA